LQPILHLNPTDNRHILNRIQQNHGKFLQLCTLSICAIVRNHKSYRAQKHSTFPCHWSMLLNSDFWKVSYSSCWHTLYKSLDVTLQKKAHHYKDRSVNAVHRNNYCVLWELCKKQTRSMGKMLSFWNDKGVGTQ